MWEERGHLGPPPACSKWYGNPGVESPTGRADCFCERKDNIRRPKWLPKFGFRCQFEVDSELNFLITDFYFNFFLYTHLYVFFFEWIILKKKLRSRRGLNLGPRRVRRASVGNFFFFLLLVIILSTLQFFQSLRWYHIWDVVFCNYMHQTRNNFFLYVTHFFFGKL